MLFKVFQVTLTHMAKGSHSSFCTWLQTASWLWSESIHFCLLVVFSPYKSDLIKTEMWSYASVFQTLNWWNSTKMLNRFNIGWNKLKFLSPIPIIRNTVRLRRIHQMPRTQQGVPFNKSSSSESINLHGQGSFWVPHALWAAESWEMKHRASSLVFVH